MGCGHVCHGGTVTNRSKHCEETVLLWGLNAREFTEFKIHRIYFTVLRVYTSESVLLWGHRPAELRLVRVARACAELRLSYIRSVYL